jgi:putative ABC transport system permease protein
MLRVKGVRTVAHLSFFGGYFQDAKNVIGAFATNVDKLALVYPELNITPELIAAMKANRPGALIGRPLAVKYGWKVGDKIPLGTTIWTNNDGSNNWSFDIVGIYDATPQFAKSPLGNAFWINYDYWDEARKFDNHRVHQFIVQIDNPKQATAISAQIDKLTENSPEETRTQTENAALQSQLKQLADINFIANAIVGAVMFTLLFLTANTMMQSVRERIPELAVLKTLGFTGGRVSTLVLIEALMLCLFAAVVGLVLSAGAMKAVGSVLGPAKLPGSVVVAGMVIAVVLALISGLPPALRAQRLNIVDALAGR